MFIFRIIIGIFKENFSLVKECNLIIKLIVLYWCDDNFLVRLYEFFQFEDFIGNMIYKKKENNKMLYI